MIDSAQFDLDGLLRLAERHMVSALVLQRLVGLRLQPDLRARVAPVAEQAILRVMAANALVRQELRRLSKLFGRAGVSFVHIKGLAIDRSPVRITNDLDVLIRREDLERARAALERDGYRYVGSEVISEKEKQRWEKQLTWNNQFQFRSPHGGLTVEVHINLFERDRIRLENLGRLLDSVDEFRQESSFDDELGCLIPSLEASLALLCVHSATKRSPALNTYILRHGYEIVHALQKGIDEARFVELCRSWAIGYYAYVSLRIAAESLGSTEAAATARRLEPLLTRRQQRLAEIHCRCYRGLGRASLVHRARYTLYMPFAIGGGLAKSLLWYWRALFPPLWYQEELFGISRSSPAIYLTYLAGPFVRLYSILTARRS